MDIFTQIGNAIHDFLVNLVGGVFIQIFNEANEQTGQIATQVSLSPSEWNSGIFTMVRNLSNNVILPIAGMIITFVLCYELITAITERNNMRDVDVDTFIKYIFKAGVAVFLLSHTFDIVLGIFDVSEWVVNTASSSITNDTYVDVISIYNNFKGTLETMDNGSLILLFLEVSIVSLAVKAIAILVAVILINRMIEIYLYCSVAPIPFATITNREWGNVGTNYLRSLLSLAFQSFFIMVIVGIYSVLVKQLQFTTSLNDMVVQLGIYSVVLCMALLNTSNIMLYNKT